MIARIVSIAAWLGVGAAVLGGMYWLFLNTPEANVLMLGASVLLIILMVIGVAIIVNSAVLVARGQTWRYALARGVRTVPWFLIAAIPLVLIWWDVLATDAWVGRHAGEISAWFIARLGWADIEWLFTIETWLSRWLRWAFAPVVALCLLSALLSDGAGALRRTQWIRRVLHWRTLVPATLVFILLFALPWQLVDWRPELPPTSVEVMAAAARLGSAAILIVVGAALLVTTAARPSLPSAPSAPSTQSHDR